MNPILLDIPYPIVTDRLIIRPPLPGDGPELNRAVVESLTELQQWMPWAPKIPPPLEDSEANAREAFATWIRRDDLRMSVFDKVTKHMVASTGLHRIHWQARRFEIGYWARTPFAGQGYLSESVVALTQFAFRELGANKVEVRCDPNNTKSRRIPEKLGFELEACLKADTVIPNVQGARDTLVFARFNADGLPNVNVRWDG
jgi:RimJ/RimL family protein N-acetyltransferase